MKQELIGSHVRQQDERTVQTKADRAVHRLSVKSTPYSSVMLNDARQLYAKHTLADGPCQ